MTTTAVLISGLTLMILFLLAMAWYWVIAPFLADRIADRESREYVKRCERAQSRHR